jgi:hypothetical protein
VVNGEVYPITFFLSARTALRTSERFPNGRLQPYGHLGVSSVILRASVHYPGLSAHLFKGVIPVGSGGEDLSRIILSPYIVTGLAWGLSPDWYVFGEWRRTEFNTTSETVNSDLSGPPSGARCPWRCAPTIITSACRAGSAPACLLHRSRNGRRSHGLKARAFSRLLSARLSPGGTLHR